MTEPIDEVDVAETLHELNQVVEADQLDTSGTQAGPLGQVHPLGWVALAVIGLAVVFHIKGSNWLIGNFAWWHWVGLLAIVAISARPGPIHAVSRFIDAVTDFFDQGANRFTNPWAGFVTLVVALGLGGLLTGPLQGLADWTFGVQVDPVGGGDFDITSSGAAGWIRTMIAAAIVSAGLILLYRVASRILPADEISIPVGAIMGVATFFVTLIVVGLVGSWATGVTTGFALAVLIAGLAIGPLWVIAWGIFCTIFFYVVTRYTARFIEVDIIIGEVNSLGLQLFGLLALLGVGYGVKAGVNPRIDFWWAEFSNRRKAWLDLVLHVTLMIPFLWAGLRLLHSYSKTNLGFKTDFSGETDGSWPASWHVWETWKQAGDAGNLPVGPVRAMIFVGFVLFLAQILSETIKSGFVINRREDLADLKQVDAPTRIE